MSGGLSRFQSSVGTIGKGVGQIGGGIERVAGSLLKYGAAGAAAVGGFFVYNLKQGIDSLHELELQNAATVAGLKSTDGASGQTAESIRKLAEQYEDLNATIDDKVIQSGENLLLTFPKITKNAFEPALEAALNLNQALGGGEEGLQDSIIRIGKALQDPIRGVTALRRVGVSFTQDQQKQIKALVESNDLYGAQQIILQELAVEFGGRFAAAGDTAAGRIAHLHDNVEELQKTLAGPFAGEGGVIDRVVGKLGDFLGEAGTVTAVQNLGDAIAGLFDDDALDRGVGLLRSGLDLLTPENLGKVGASVGKAIDFVKGIDFATIGRSLEVAGRVAKTTIDAFMALPPSVQAIVVGAFAANKLSGGLLASGIGNVAKGVGGLLTGGGLLGRGSSPANPVFVSQVGGVPGAGGPVPVGGIGGLLSGALKGLLFVGVATAIGEFLAQNVTRPLNPTQFDYNGAAAQSGIFPNGSQLGIPAANKYAQELADKLGIPLDQVKQGIVDAVNQRGLTFEQAVRELTAATKAGVPAGELGRIARYANETKTGVARAAEQQAGVRADANRAATNNLDRLRAIAGAAERTAAKNFSPSFTANITNNVTAHLSVTQALYQISTYSQIREGGS